MGNKFINFIAILLIAIGLLEEVKAGDVIVQYSPDQAQACYSDVSGQQTPQAPYKKQSCVAYADYLTQSLESLILPGPIGLASGITDAAFYAGFNMTDAANNSLDNEGAVNSAGIKRCDQHTDDVKFCYKILGQDYKCASLKDGESKTIYGMMFRGKNYGELVCAEYNAVLWKTAGCKIRKDPSVATLKYNCYTPLSCGQRSHQNSRAFFPITSGIVQCFDESLDTVFFSNCCANDNTATKNNMLSNFQSSMRGIVRILLTLYVITWGIRIALGAEMPRKGEVFMFGMKFLLVIYFSVGFQDPLLTDGGECTNNHKMNDGLTKYLIPGLEGLTTTLSNIMIDAGGNTTLCKFNPSDYDAKYANLALWDSIDCKFLYYLGVSAGDGIVNFALSVLSLIVGLLFTFKIIEAILIILFSLFIMGMIIYFVHAYLIAKFGLVLLIYLAPLFVPLALFEQTKQFFQGWMKLAFSFALQPVIIAAFIALIFTVFDEVLYNTCQFDSKVITPNAQGCKEYQVFTINNASANDSQCNTTFGYFLAQKTWSIGTKSAGGIINLPSTSVNLDLSQLIYVVVFAFLFFNFSQMLGALAADLTGGVVINATNMTGGLVGQGVKAIVTGSKGMAQGAASLGMKAANLASNNKPRPPAPRP